MRHVCGKAPNLRGIEGFTLLEVMIVGGIMSIFMLAMLQMQEQQTRMMMTQEAQFESGILYSNINQILSDPISCSYSMVDAIAAVYPGLRAEELPAKPIPIPSLSRYVLRHNGKLVVNTGIHAGQRIGSSLRLEEMELVPHAEFSGEFDFYITVKRLKKVYGGETIARKLWVNVLEGPFFQCGLPGSTDVALPKKALALLQFEGQDKATGQMRASSPGEVVSSR